MTRVDCLTKDYAIEFDFANKWAESVGQSLYYAHMTKKKPAVVLIMSKLTDMKYVKRVERLDKDIQIFLIKTFQNQRKTKIFFDYRTQIVQGKNATFLALCRVSKT